MRINQRFSYFWLKKQNKILNNMPDFNHFYSIYPNFTIREMIVFKVTFKIPGLVVWWIAIQSLNVIIIIFSLLSTSFHVRIFKKVWKKCYITRRRRPPINFGIKKICSWHNASFHRFCVICLTFTITEDDGIG